MTLKGEFTPREKIPFTRESWEAYKKYQDSIPGREGVMHDMYWYTFTDYMDFCFREED